MAIYDRSRRCWGNPDQLARTRNPFHSHENEMTYNNQLLPLAQQLKQESGTRYSVRYLIKHYKTTEALQKKLNWLRGCNRSIG